MSVPSSITAMREAFGGRVGWVLVVTDAEGVERAAARGLRRVARGRIASE